MTEVKMNRIESDASPILRATFHVEIDTRDPVAVKRLATLLVDLLPPDEIGTFAEKCQAAARDAGFNLPLPSGRHTPTGVDFFDKASGRKMRLITEGEFEGWLAYEHVNGFWVTYRRATDADKEAVRSMLDGGTAQYPTDGSE